MSEVMVGQAEAFIEGYNKGLEEAKRIVLEKSENALFSVHYFGREAAKEIDILRKDKPNE